MIDVLFTKLMGSPIGIYLENKYIAALVVLVIFAIVGKLVLVIFNYYLKNFAKKTKTLFDDMIFERTKNPIFYLVLAYGVKLALKLLFIDGPLTKLVNSVLAIFFILLISRTVDTVIDAWGETFSKRTKNHLDDVLFPVLHKAVKVVFVIFVFLWILDIWKINITPYLAGVGISGIVLGLALQDSLKNVFGGISLILDKSFNIHDPVRLETGELGRIKSIGLRSTKILSYDNEVIFVPNGQLANMKIHNYMKPNDQVRKVVEFSVEYGSDPENVKKVVLKALGKIKEIHDDPYMDVIHVQMGDSGLHFKARFFVQWDNSYKKWVEATQAIYSALRKAGIGIPFPTRTVYMKNSK
jgi:MscS family membrane protein